MINNVTLMGRLTADPELKTTTSGLSVTTFSIAVDRRFTKAGDERKADFINIVAWRQQADFICRYFKKGQMIALTGSIQTRSYEDRDGKKRTAFEVVADNVSFCGSKTDSAASAGVASDNAPAPAYQTATASDFEEVVVDDDLPF